MPTIDDIIKQTEILAGGPGSGPHKGFGLAGKRMHDHLIRHTFKQTGTEKKEIKNFKPGTTFEHRNYEYAHKDGKIKVAVKHDGSYVMGKEKGNGPAEFDDSLEEHMYKKSKKK